ncbi:sel1 repeat family protein [Nitrogeniibacter mangrovi]|uniref:Sel1 repeat family protein n=2 Tax=Nitrogeniibacter mangrovi TaxID=2016596 RepID=A0A6C1B8N1_9RHOO|nr:sel1 repeat family protein [Nitrogeniibacter mangrovi]
MAAAELSEEELADIVHKPSLGLYKGYAEFKMAHYDNARQIWRALVDKGNAEAWFNLGLLAEDGLGEPRDMVEALARYTRGAEAGSTKAQYRLARIYLDGQGVPADPARGEAWLARAAAGGDDAAKEELAALRAGAPADPFVAARRLESTGDATAAAEAYEKLSEAGDLRARTRLAWLYEAGRGVERDLARAADLFQSAAEAGEAEAQFALSVMYETGTGRPKDPQAARRWLQQSAEAGYPEAVAHQRARSAN